MKITKKLRDVTPEEYSNWKRIDCCSGAVCYKCPFYNVSCCEDSVDSWVHHKDLYSDKFLDQTIEIEMPDILTKEEKEYLSAVIKPFRDRVICIKKISSTLYDDREFIEITIDNLFAKRFVFPYFKKNSMYRDMESYRKYTLEELGL